MVIGGAGNLTEIVNLWKAIDKLEEQILELKRIINSMNLVRGKCRPTGGCYNTTNYKFNKKK